MRVVQAAADTVEIEIIGPIGAEYEGGISAKDVLDALRYLPDSTRTITVHVHSPGGNPFDAVAIGHALREQRAAKGRTVDVRIAGLAASAATVITSAGSSVRMTREALFMVHLPWTITFGDARVHQDAVNALAAVTDSIIAAYRWKSHLSEAALRQLMSETTWMDLDAAIRNGFVTEELSTSGHSAAAAAVFPQALAATLRSVPPQYRDRLEALIGRGLGIPGRSSNRRPTGRPDGHRQAAPAARRDRPAARQTARKTMADLVAGVYGPGSTVDDSHVALIGTSARGGR